MRRLWTSTAVTRLDPDVPLPSYARQDDAGADLVRAEDVDLAPGQRAVVGTGIAIALPAGYAAFVHPRSGLAARHGVTLVNAPGTIDAGYRGEIKVILLNTDPATAGLVPARRPDRPAGGAARGAGRASARWPALPESARGDNGFGSTGGHAGGTRRRRDRRGENGGEMPVFGRRRSAGDRDAVGESAADLAAEAAADETRPARPPAAGPWDVAEPHPDCQRSTSAACRCRCWRGRTSSWCSPSSTAPG